MENPRQKRLVGQRRDVGREDGVALGRHHSVMSMSLRVFFTRHSLSTFAVQLQCGVASMWPREHVMY